MNRGLKINENKEQRASEYTKSGRAQKRNLTLHNRLFHLILMP